MLLIGRIAVTHRVWQTLVAFAYFLAIEVLCVIPNAQAGVVHSVTPDSEYTGYAELFPYVGYLEVADGAGGYQFGGSAVALSAHWVLTSQHNVPEDLADTSSLYSGFRVGFGSNFLTDRGDVYSALSVVLHPGYIAGGGGMDMALLYFDAPISDMHLPSDIEVILALRLHLMRTWSALVRLGR